MAEELLVEFCERSRFCRSMASRRMGNTFSGSGVLISIFSIVPPSSVTLPPFLLQSQGLTRPALRTMNQVIELLKRLIFFSFLVSIPWRFASWWGTPRPTPGPSAAPALVSELTHRAARGYSFRPWVRFTMAHTRPIKCKNAKPGLINQGAADLPRLRLSRFPD